MITFPWVGYTMVPTVTRNMMWIQSFTMCFVGQKPPSPPLQLPFISFKPICHSPHTLCFSDHLTLPQCPSLSTNLSPQTSHQTTLMSKIIVTIPYSIPKMSLLLHNLIKVKMHFSTLRWRSMNASEPNSDSPII